MSNATKCLIDKMSNFIFHIMRKIKYDIKETHGNNSRKNFYNFY